MLKYVFAFSLLGAAVADAAEPRLLDGAALKDKVGGATIELDTPIGSKIPMRFTPDGRVSGDAPNLAFYLGSPSDRGNWWIEDNRLCQKWKTWFDAERHCFELRQAGDVVHWKRGDGKTGTATLLQRDPPPVQIATMTVMSAPPVAAPQAAAQPPAVSATPPPPPPIASADVRMPVRQSLGRPPTATVPATKPLDPKAKVSAADPIRVASKPDAVPPVRRPDQPTFRVAGVDEDDRLFVRRGPSSDYPAVGAIPPQARGVQITGECQQEWCPIVHQGLGGWVNSYYLSAEPLPHRRW